MTLLMTARLRGSPAGVGDFATLRLLHGDPRAAATLSADGAVPEERTRRLLLLASRQAGEPGLGLWLFADAGGDFVGYCGLLPVTIAGEQAVELLYAVMPGHWRRGYAKEMAAAVLAHGFVAGLREVVGFTLPHNVASRRVMESQGFVYERDIVHANLPHVLYRLRR